MVSKLVSICADDKIHCCRQTIRHQKAKELIAARAREGGRRRRRRRRSRGAATAAVLGGALCVFFFFFRYWIFLVRVCCNSRRERQRQTEVKQMAHFQRPSSPSPPLSSPSPLTSFLSLPAPPRLASPRPARSNKKKFQPFLFFFFLWKLRQKVPRARTFHEVEVPGF